jgi:hypothetical protein
MKRESLKMSEEDWRRFTDVAAATSSIYSGYPSWRRLCLRIARGEVQCKETPKAKARPKVRPNIPGETPRTQDHE